MRTFLAWTLLLTATGIQARSSQWLNEMVTQKEERLIRPHTQGLEQKAQGFFSTHGLLFFYGSQCPYCKQFAPVLHRWAKQQRAEVLPLSLDNQALPEFPKFLPATTEWINAAFGSNAINYPALFVVNPKTQAIYPVGFGSMSDVELNARMELLISKINAYETKGGLQ